MIWKVCWTTALSSPSIDLPIILDLILPLHCLAPCDVELYIAPHRLAGGQCARVQHAPDTKSMPYAVKKMNAKGAKTERFFCSIKYQEKARRRIPGPQHRTEVIPTKGSALFALLLPPYKHLHTHSYVIYMHINTIYFHTQRLQLTFI